MKLFFPSLAIALLCFSCRKMVAIDPPSNQLTYDKIFSNESSLEAAVVNAYTALAAMDQNLTTPVALYTDELVYAGTDPGTAEFFSSGLSVTNSAVANLWRNAYSVIYQSNLILEALASPYAHVSDSAKIQAQGEALFLRAWAYSLLVETIGEVPLILHTDVDVNRQAARADRSALFAQMEQDLRAAQLALRPAYIGGEKIRANRWAAAALLARVYLEEGKWTEAETEATAVIQSGVYQLAPVNSVFLKNSVETVWALWNANGFSNLAPGLLASGSGIPTYSLSPPLLAQFETGDARKAQWTKVQTVGTASYFYPYKYKNRTTTTGVAAEYTIYLRLAELFLLRAEARARTARLAEAVADLNTVRARAGVPPVAPIMAQGDLLAKIQKERQTELLTEGNFRLVDLRRTGQLDAVLGPLKPSWRSAAQWFPVPQVERQVNPFLSQNPGY